ncbi:MAG TPA: cytochrome C [Spirochaetes bacterium]|nr:cytochrome C [Spirochaetota bacterium]
MYNKSTVIPGLFLFLAIVSFPLWNNALGGKPRHSPDPKLPTDMKQCVESKEYMRDYHMQLVDRWRDEVVREAKRETISIAGVHYHKSLSGTCMKCHSSKKDFCDQCHDYLGVAPYCWDCHTFPKEKTK